MTEADCGDPPALAPGERGIAVTLHDIEPRTFTRVKEIREWFTRHQVDRLTLAVIPAADLHPVGTRAPLLAAWLRGQAARGDAIAQHGLQHRGHRAEFSGLGDEESRGRVQAGLAMLREVELDPHGFIAPSFAYTPILRDVLADRFAWFAERSVVRGETGLVSAPALTLSADHPLRVAMAPAVGRLQAPFSRELVRLDVHPGDFDHARRIRAIERVLARTTDRRVLTYDDVFSAAL